MRYTNKIEAQTQADKLNLGLDTTIKKWVIEVYFDESLNVIVYELQLQYQIGGEVSAKKKNKKIKVLLYILTSILIYKYL